MTSDQSAYDGAPPAAVDALERLGRETTLETLLPGEADVRSYEEHGWYKSPVILSEEQLDTARCAADDHQRGHRERPLPRRARFSDWTPGDGDGVRNNEFVSLQNDTFRLLSLNRTIGAIAARLARTDQIRLFDDQLVFKPPASAGGDSAVGWHTDGSYWSTCTSERMLTAWIPFHDVGLANAPLVMIDGSHRWPGTEHLRGFNDPDLDGIESQLGESAPQAVERVPILLKKGQVSFHHARTIHASYPNQSEAPRYALAVHYQDRGNRYRRFHDPSGNLIELPHDQLCRRLASGDPDYSDPDAFPVAFGPTP